MSILLGRCEIGCIVMWHLLWEWLKMELLVGLLHSEHTCQFIIQRLEKATSGVVLHTSVHPFVSLVSNSKTPRLKRWFLKKKKKFHRQGLSHISGDWGCSLLILFYKSDSNFLSQQCLSGLWSCLDCRQIWLFLKSNLYDRLFTLLFASDEITFVCADVSNLSVV